MHADCGERKFAILYLQATESHHFIHWFDATDFCEQPNNVIFNGDISKWLQVKLIFSNIKERWNSNKQMQRLLIVGGMSCSANPRHFRTLALVNNRMLV